MVAYSFKRRFVDPIRTGSKRQTIRAVGKRRHAHHGDELQLYTGMRSKQCELIGRARCVDMAKVTLVFDRGLERVFFDGVVMFDDRLGLDEFARDDGFGDFGEFREFWRTEHGAIERWSGMLIKWERFEPARMASLEL